MSGPSKDWLKHMRKMLPSLAKGVVEKRTIGKGNKALLRRKPRKVCSYCTRLFDHALFKDAESPKLEVDTCPECKAKLDDGFVAIVATGNRICFVKSERLKDMAGKCVRVSPDNFDRIAKEYDLNWAPAKSDHDQPQPPPNPAGAPG